MTAGAARLGIDLGGTKIEGVVLAADGSECARQRVPTPAGDYPATLAALSGLVAALEAEAGLQAPAIGIGTPGSLSRLTGRMKNSNSACLNGQPLREDLAARLGRPVRLANDADCFTLSEAVDGAAAGAGIVFGIILGTGVGGGIAFEQRILCGPNGISGEWGHNRLPQPALAVAAVQGLATARRCGCGRENCIESWLSGPALLRSYRQLGGAATSTPALAASALDGEPAAITALALHAEQLALALAEVINILDPDAIVVGGGLSHLTTLYAEVPRHWPGPVFSDRIDTRLLPARFGDASGVRGAAWLAAG